MTTEASLNNETLEFMKSIGLTQTMSEEFGNMNNDKKKIKNEKNTKEKKVQMKVPTQPIVNKNDKKEKSKQKSPPTPKMKEKPQKGKSPPPPQEKSKEDKQKVKARKWGKEGKEVKSQNQTEELTIKGNVKPSSTELNWLHVKVDGNQQLLTLSGDQKWYDLITSFDDIDYHDYKISKQSLEEINSKIETIFQQEVTKYHRNKSLSTSSLNDEKWMNDVIRSGTLSDKIAALALRIQQSPPHELESFDILITMALKKEQRTSQLALEAIKDLLIHNLLPSNRRLIPYSLRPLGGGGSGQMSLSILFLFWYENELIKRIELIIKALENGLKSSVDFYKIKCMEIISIWLSTKPEHENILLTLLVNKLGDPSSKVASKCITLLGNILYEHPVMKLVMIREVRQLISRSNLIPRAVYSGILFLSQIKLSSSSSTAGGGGGGGGAQENKVAIELVDCYVSLFEKAVTQDTLGSKLLAALLTGINRAYPFLKNKTSLTKHTDALFKIVHQSSFSSATQALTLLSYLALGSPHQAAQAQALDKKLKAKKLNETENQTDSVSNSKPEEGARGGGAGGGGEGNLELISRYYNSLYSKLLSDEILTRSHNTLFLNLVFRSMKRDPVELRVLAFCKRILICSTHATPPIAAGLIFLVSEVCRSHPSLIEKLLSTPEPCPTPPESDPNPPSSSNSRQPTNNQTEDSYFLLGNFDGSKRNPAYACNSGNGEDATAPAPPCNSWEIVLFKSHFNPSVQSFAKSFLNSMATPPHTISYSGDPTIDFSLTSFLNRFAYKNPKKQQVEQRRKRSQVLSEEPINLTSSSSSALLLESTEVAPEKVFFYKFFGERNRLIAEGKSRKKKRRTSDDDDEDDENRSDLGSDFDEAEIDRFADKLADELMENYAAGAGNPDLDDDDLDGDDEDLEEEEGDFDEGDFGDDAEDEDDDDSDIPPRLDDLDDDDDDEAAAEIDFDDMPGKKKKKASVVEMKESLSRNKKRKKDKHSEDDVFAAAEDFEDEMEANLVGVTENESNENDFKSKKSKKRSRH